jgi:hypothetical protein
VSYSSLLVLYGAGVVWCLLMSDARPTERFTLALLWPLGPLAFVVTVAILLAASLIAYPGVMVPALIVIGIVWWFLF